MVVQIKKERSGKRLKVTFHISKSSPNAEVLLGILDSPEGTRIAKEKALDAIRTFWLPTYRQEAGYPTAQLKETARRTIWRLQEQIYYLQSLFDLEMPSMAEHSVSISRQRQVNLVPTPTLDTEAKETVIYDPQQLDWSFDEAELGGIAS